MIIKLFGVVDRVSGVVDGPHKGVNEGAFLRSFQDACKQGAIAEHPEDFYAIEIGTYNDSDGSVVPLEGGPKRIADATDFKYEEK